MKTVLIIIGSARSGSTLLTKAIGGHSECFAGGELNRFDEEIINEETQCGCLKYLKDCNFWNQIFDAFELNKKENRTRDNDLFKIGIYNQITEKKYIHYLLPVIFFKRPYANNKINDRINNTIKLFNQLFKITDSKVLVDSSKGLFRALVLASRENKEIQFKFINLIRDGRGILNSNLKNSYSIIQSDGSKQIVKTDVKKDPIKIIKQWRYINIRNYLILKSFRRTQTLFLKYEDFTVDPAETLKCIFKFLNLDFEEQALRLGENENHILGGNASRMNAKMIQKQDEAWKRNLDKETLNLFYKKAGWLNNLLGYKK